MNIANQLTRETIKVGHSVGSHGFTRAHHSQALENDRRQERGLMFVVISVHVNVGIATKNFGQAQT